MVNTTVFCALFAFFICLFLVLKSRTAYLQCSSFISFLRKLPLTAFGRRPMNSWPWRCFFTCLNLEASSLPFAHHKSMRRPFFTNLIFVDLAFFYFSFFHYLRRFFLSGFNIFIFYHNWICYLLNYNYYLYF